MAYQSAKRRGTKLLVGLTGFSGSGKTVSALRLARGIVGEKGCIALLDTESGRGSMYAGEVPLNEQGQPDGPAMIYDVDELEAPFEPKRYIDKIQGARKHGADLLIIDSASHSWEGIGGVLDMADALEPKFGQFGKWNKPKGESRKLSNEILHCGMHIIVNMRGKDKHVQVPDPEKPGKKMITSLGLTPIIDDRILYELTVSLYMKDDKTPEWRKGVGALERLFITGRFINESHGQAMRAWADGGEPVDHDLRRKMSEGREAALLGVQALAKWWGSLSKPEQAALATLKDELKQIASDIEANRQDDGEQPSSKPAFQTENAPA